MQTRNSESEINDIRAQDPKVEGIEKVEEELREEIIKPHFEDTVKEVTQMKSKSFIDEDEQNDPWSAADTSSDDENKDKAKIPVLTATAVSPDNRNNNLINRFAKWRNNNNNQKKVMAQASGVMRSVVGAVVANNNNNNITNNKRELRHSPSEGEEEVNYLTNDDFEDDDGDLLNRPNLNRSSLKNSSPKNDMRNDNFPKPMKISTESLVSSVSSSSSSLSDESDRSYETDRKSSSDSNMSTPNRNVRGNDDMNNSSFHGRYKEDIVSEQGNQISRRRNTILDSIKKTVSNSVPLKERNNSEKTQTKRILRSSAASHMQSLLDQLETPGQYVMLLGSGMLGVNLKQTYLPNGGVYVDYIVPGGNAHKSGVIHVGDSLVKVGDVDVSKGTIHDVPAIIAASPRPCTIILNGEQQIDWSKMDYVTIAVAMVNRIRQQAKDQHEFQQSLEPLKKPETPLLMDGETLRSNSSLLDTEDEEEDENGHISADNEKQTTSDKKNGDDYNPAKKTWGNNVVYNRSLPSKKSRRNLNKFAQQRNNEVKTLYSAVSHFATYDEKFRFVLREGLIACCIDFRRLPFLAQYLESEDCYFVKPNNKNEGDNIQVNTWSSRLMLYLDLLKYKDLFGMTPPNRCREHFCDIAYKYLLPYQTLTGQVLPQYNLQALFPKETLDDLDTLVRESNFLGEEVKDRIADLFFEIEQTVQESLSGPKFASFLLSDQCARMRALMRKTNPYVDPPLPSLLTGLTTNDGDNVFAHNHFLFIITYLLCQQVTNDTNTENVNNDLHEVDDDENSTRIVGAACGICCIIYIKKHLEKCISDATYTIVDSPLTEELNEDQIMHSNRLIYACEHFWEVFVAPGGGMLDSINHGTETKNILDTVRRKLVTAVTPPKALSTMKQQRRHMLEQLTCPDFTQCIRRLSDELYYDYALNIHPKYRKHRIHDWMCEEVNKAVNEREESEQSMATTISATINNSNELSCDDESSTNSSKSDPTLPPLPKDAIMRLLRRSEFPAGISKHRPIRRVDTPSANSDFDEKDKVSECATYQGAECAIVFGTDDGMDSTGRLPNPALAVEQGSIRRFASVSLMPEELQNTSDYVRVDKIPSTLESYAIVPSFCERLFSNAIDESRISRDGWEISLVNFMIPNANSDAAPNESSIYGVSLVFHQSIANLKESDESERSSHYTYETELISSEHLLEKNESSSMSQKDIKEFPDTQKELSLGCQKSDLHDDCPSLEKKSQPSSKSFVSPISYSKNSAKTYSTEKSENLDAGIRYVRLSHEVPDFNKQLKVMRFSERVEKRKSSSDKVAGVTVGIALVSKKNNIPSMRDTLAHLFDDFTKTPDEDQDSTKNGLDKQCIRLCAPLVDILGTFSLKNVEVQALKYILNPYLKFSASLWVDRPISDQKAAFEAAAGELLLDSLPPIPLALTFITCLLEQKIVLSSSRRSILLSISMILRELLNPLEWSHLFVPLVPTALANDLVQYPAPFILGIPSEDKGSMELLNSLPEDVTLVDLDVGRVILAREFSGDFELLKSCNGNAATIVRTQVLCLAEALGGVVGAKLYGKSWKSDSPFVKSSSDIYGDLDPTKKMSNEEKFIACKKVFKAFILELLVGVKSCCFWIEEKSLNPLSPQSTNSTITNESVVIFDEDRFLQIKDLRAQGLYMPLLMGEKIVQDDDGYCKLNPKTDLALSIDGFDLFLETFLRGQGMSTYISSRQKKLMVFW